ncbi:CAP domain-containing protein [Streptomyces sp. NPDC091972]|uniref:CAP domain-containing protein n=1 Tax=Streptomyces sp. NPDC091972 TaxID=3366007 RepID=UPI0038065E5A
MIKARVWTIFATLVFLPFLPTDAAPAWADPSPFPGPSSYPPPAWSPPGPAQWQAPGPPQWPGPDSAYWQTSALSEDGAEPASGSAASGAAPSSAAQEVVNRINRTRSAVGCAPLRLRTALSRAAQRHSDDMARHARLSHTGSDGSSPADRLRAAGYRATASGETIASGAASPSAVVALWRDSGPHREILLACRYTHAGVGVATGARGPWWTADLASGG